MAVDQQQVVFEELVSFVAEHLKESHPSFAEECDAAYTQGQLASALPKLLSVLPAVFEMEGMEGVCNSCIRLCASLEQGQKHLLNLADIIAQTDNTSGAEARLRALKNVFNRIDSNDQQRCHVFKNIVALACSASLVSAIEKQLEALPRWLKEWTGGSDGELERSTYVHVATCLDKAQRQTLAYQFWLRALRALSTASASEQSSARPMVERTIAYALSSHGDFELYALSRLPVVQNLDSPLKKALEAFVSGDYEAYTSSGATAAIFQQHGFDEAQANRRVRLMVLANKCADRSEVSLADIAEAIHIEEAEAEDWVIEVVRAGLMDAKIDEMAGTVVITRAKQTKFDAEDWKQLRDQLQMWHENIARVSSMLGRVTAMAK